MLKITKGELNNLFVHGVMRKFFVYLHYLCPHKLIKKKNWITCLIMITVFHKK
ncbi:hypothetical protein GLOIN_2v1700581 [Rhizophagus irregularis DAOM 181602=DAOM 197198]|uniref:Uncharacterized protein n=1 Tax=Rhizophagus irregularis (strain DAOM 181602 / DAOM 197198 / MUCL 43194) TaxID=747089 RepID=A0A2P4P924_RHIID|nr:hypothetical protein GLOIN_2v1700581 [Rhizophagus irregularis DAOM 181602=DAOM 197198]POG61881.1 hypothetical protein GLOIN_2v1700581 [Rhizophagus irregularis DAOM 181602=DAOM 197198]|eukprot:XP_025168747.1 hypothetical protein GLOIN_2v1700581 [Rhizophagus irregularis DAOM 181602=DAOM 197198]